MEPKRALTCRTFGKLTMCLASQRSRGAQREISDDIVKPSLRQANNYTVAVQTFSLGRILLCRSVELRRLTHVSWPRRSSEQGLLLKSQEVALHWHVRVFSWYARLCLRVGAIGTISRQNTLADAVPGSPFLQITLRLWSLKTQNRMGTAA